MSDAREKAGAAALAAVKKFGLCGGPDSPPEWEKALTGAIAGDPILVKHPTDERDDFFLVPLNPADPSARLGVWAMLDAKTLELREASLLKDWKTPAFPDPDKDVKQLSQSLLTLADGTVKQFTPSEITPNSTNLVWAPSSAAVLPYWPVKEFTVPHPVTGAPEKIYLNQDGEIHTTLDSDDHDDYDDQASETSTPTKTPDPKPNRFMNIATKLLASLSLPLLGWNGYLSTKLPKENDPSGKIEKLEEKVQSLDSHIHDQELHRVSEEIISELNDLQNQVGILKAQLGDLAKHTHPENLKHSHKDTDQLIATLQKDLAAVKVQGANDLKVSADKLQNQINSILKLYKGLATQEHIINLQGQIRDLKEQVSKIEKRPVSLTKIEIQNLIKASITQHERMVKHGGSTPLDLTKIEGRLAGLEAFMKNHAGNNRIHDGDAGIVRDLGAIKIRLKSLEESIKKTSKGPKS